MRSMVVFGFMMTLGYSSNPQALADKCYGMDPCDAFKNCHYCKQCNNGGTKCGVWRESNGIAKPGKEKRSKPKM